MAAGKVNFLVIYKGTSQVYGCASEKIALESPPPEGVPIEDKRILFVTYRPDTEELVVHPLEQDDIINAELKYPKSRKKEQDDEQEE